MCLFYVIYLSLLKYGLETFQSHFGSFRELFRLKLVLETRAIAGRQFPADRSTEQNKIVRVSTQERAGRSRALAGRSPKSADRSPYCADFRQTLYLRVFFVYFL